VKASAFFMGIDTGQYPFCHQGRNFKVVF